MAWWAMCARPYRDHDGREAKRHELGDPQGQPAVESDVVVDVNHLAAFKIHQDVVQVPVAQAQEVAKYGRCGDRPRVATDLGQPRGAARAAAPQLALQQVARHLR